MSKDNIFTYEPKMKANWELIADIMRCDCQEIVYKDRQLADLEAKLAEKEKTTNNLINETQDLKKTLQVVSNKLIEKEKELEKFKIKDTVGLSDFIDKNSKKLAIAKLEKVKELVTNVFNESFGEICISDVKEIIDNQIEELKKEK